MIWLNYLRGSYTPGQPLLDWDILMIRAGDMAAYAGVTLTTLGLLAVAIVGAQHLLKLIVSPRAGTA